MQIISLFLVLFTALSVQSKESKSDKACNALYKKVGADYDLPWHQLDIPRPLRAVQDEAVEAKMSLLDFKKLAEKKGFKDTHTVDEKEYNATMLLFWCGKPTQSENVLTDKKGRIRKASEETQWSGPGL